MAIFMCCNYRYLEIFVLAAKHTIQFNKKDKLNIIIEEPPPSIRVTQA